MVEMSKFLSSSSSQLVKSNELVKTQSGEGNGGLGSNLKLWQLALLIGVPTGVVAYLLYRYSNRKTIKPVAEAKKSPAKSATSVAKEETKTATTAAADTAPKTPFERAVDIKNQGNKFFQQGKFQEAAQCYAEAITLCPLSDKQELPKFYQNRAAAYENLKMYDKVIEDCTAALNIDPGYTKALMRRAKAYENSDQLQEAFEDLTKLCILDKFSATAMASADRMVKKIGQKMASEKFKTRKGLAISQHFVNNFYIGLNNDVIFNNKAFYEKVEAAESSADMLNALKDFAEGRYSSCIENCSKAIDSGDQFALEARNLRGSLYMLKCQYKEAIDDFETILNDPKADKRLKSNTLIKFTALNLQNGQEDEAFGNYERAVELDPANEDIYCNRAQVFAMKGRFEECFADFNKCLELNNDHKIAKLQKAFFEFRQFYAQLTMYKQATEGANSHEAIINSRELKEETTKLEKLISEYADIPEAYNLYAQILSEQENFEKAETYYKTALTHDPKNAALLVQRALNHMTWKNEFDDAIQMLNDAIKVDDTCEFAYETLATIEIQRGNLPRAVELFEKAIELTRNEESMTNLCSMLVGAQTQFKVLKSNASQMPNGLDFFNSLGM